MKSSPASDAKRNIAPRRPEAFSLRARRRAIPNPPTTKSKIQPIHGANGFRLNGPRPVPEGSDKAGVVDAVVVMVNFAVSGEPFKVSPGGDH